MKFLTLSCAVILWWCFPVVSQAQNMARIECARNDGYVYLYSSMATLDVRATLPCGAVIQITGRFQGYAGVTTAKGDSGFVPLGNLVLLKDAPGSGPAMPATPARERMHYDDPAGPKAAPARSNVPPFTLLNDTPVRVKLVKALSSATAHVGEAVEFEVLEDLAVEGQPVLRKGAKASGVVAEADVKRRFGHGGKLAVSLTLLKLEDGEPVPVRCYVEVSGSTNNSADSVLPLASGKDVELLKDSEYTALVDGDVHLKREGFSAPGKEGATPNAGATSGPGAAPRR
jgi:hypothetical protein